MRNRRQFKYRVVGEAIMTNELAKLLVSQNLLAVEAHCTGPFYTFFHEPAVSLQEPPSLSPQIDRHQTAKYRLSSFL